MSAPELGRASLGREAALGLLEAMGLPAGGCVAVDIDLPANGFATATVEYMLTDGHITAWARP